MSKEDAYLLLAALNCFESEGGPDGCFSHGYSVTLDQLLSAPESIDMRIQRITSELEDIVK